MSAAAKEPNTLIAFQGEPGAYSHLACRTAYPDREALPCPTFEAAYRAVREGEAALAMIPIENSVAGRVSDNHHLLPKSGLHIIGEHFQRVNHHLLAPRGASLETIDVVFSHVEALGQCRDTIADLGVEARVYPDTAGAARFVAEQKDTRQAAFASSLAAEIYELDVLRTDCEDAAHNTTRFMILAREPKTPALGSGPVMTTFIFQVRNVPAALYKAMGGFATNGVNMTKLESYQLGGSFNATEFYADIEGHPEERLVQLALEELDFFTHKMEILGVYPCHEYRERYALFDSSS